MGTLSKTAKASMVKEVKQTAVETPEEALRQLRLNLDAGLYVTPQRIRTLVEAYDQAREQLMMQLWAKALVSGKSYRVSLVHDEVAVEEIDDAYSTFNDAASGDEAVAIPRRVVKNAVLGAAYDLSPRPMPGSGE